MVSVTNRHVIELVRAVPIRVEWSHFSFESEVFNSYEGTCISKIDICIFRILDFKHGHNTLIIFNISNLVSLNIKT